MVSIQQSNEVPMKNPAGTGALAAAALLCAAVPASPAERPAGTPVFTSEVSLVLLPVFIVDNAGRAVRGLAAEDFELYEDGKRTEVVSFRYVDTTSAEDQEAIRQASAELQGPAERKQAKS